SAACHRTRAVHRRAVFAQRAANTGFRACWSRDSRHPGAAARFPPPALERAGPGYGADTLRIQQFMRRNGYPYRLLDTESDTDAAGFLTCFGLSQDQLPVVVLPGKVILRNPGNAELADALGLIEALDPEKIHDVAVVGGGPAGLAAAVYAAS